MTRWSLALCLVGCGGDEVASKESTDLTSWKGGDTGAQDPDDPDETDSITVDVEDFCEPLAEGACMLPWPSDRYLRTKSSNVTGLRIAYDADAAWENSDGVRVDVSTFSRLDGFSPSSQILTIFDEPVDTDGTAFWDSIDRSLEDDHPTVLLDLETGERLAHWVETDARATDPEETVFFIRPTVRLEADRRYGVAIRELKGVSGAPLSSSAAFKAMRDDREIEPAMAELESRRPGFEELFEALEDAGVDRATLQQAWQRRGDVLRHLVAAVAIEDAKE